MREYRDCARLIGRPAYGHQDLLVEASGAAVRKLLAELTAGVELRATGPDAGELLAALRAAASCRVTAGRPSSAEVLENLW